MTLLFWLQTLGFEAPLGHVPEDAGQPSMEHPQLCRQSLALGTQWPHLRTTQGWWQRWKMGLRLPEQQAAALEVFFLGLGLQLLKGIAWP